MHILGVVIVAAQFLSTLSPNTASAFDEYLRSVDAELTARVNQAQPLAAQPEGVFHHGKGKEVPHGIVHDWSAIAFVPGAKKATAVAILEDFGRHSKIYPEVLEGRVDKREGNRIFGFHRLRKKKVLEVNLESNYQVDVLPAPPNRYANRSVATKIVEVEEAGTKNERRLQAGHDHGFLWRLQTYWTLEETPKGLWMEVRSISLTRDVPVGLGWAVKPIVRDLPRESLETLMAATKQAVLAGN
ncbi:MAG TPA: hypothetical protein VFQ91_05100 [Bryobacteraceae bacterium]|nr:hypothetical protein [Bryobacteraceae bacterium]